MDKKTPEVVTLAKEHEQAPKKPHKFLSMGVPLLITAAIIVGYLVYHAYHPDKGGKQTDGTTQPPKITLDEIMGGDFAANTGEPAR